MVSLQHTEKTNWPVFLLEDYLGEREFKAAYSFCSSDVETLAMKDLLALADEEGMALWESLSLGYTQPQGHPALKQEIARQYPYLSPSDVLCFAGAEEGIYCAMHALLDADDHVLVVTPCYQSLAAIAATICPVTCVALQEEHYWQLQLDDVQNALKPNTKLIIINFPHNPTGAILNRDVFDGLIALARQRGMYIFSDEVYHLLELDQPIAYRRWPALTKTA